MIFPRALACAYARQLLQQKNKFYQATVTPPPPPSYKASQAHSVSVDLLVTDVVLLHTQWIPYLKPLERGMKRQTDPYGKAMKK